MNTNKMSAKFNSHSFINLKDALNALIKYQIINISVLISVLMDITIHLLINVFSVEKKIVVNLKKLVFRSLNNMMNNSNYILIDSCSIRVLIFRRYFL